MKLVLVRHGETESNRLGLALGREDVALNELGVRQAQRLAGALASETVAAIYSSPLRRTMDMARAIAAAHRLEVRRDERLIEMDIGEAEGLTFAEVRERFPELIHNWGGPDGPTFRMPGGERLVDVQERAWGFVEEMARRDGQETVVAVTHNFVILSLLARALAMDLAQFRRLRHAVAAVSVLELAPEQITVLRLNDTCHLAD